MSRMLVSSIVLATCAINLPAQELKKDNLSKKPPYERMLKGEDAKKAEE